jgi:hypothetical protein
MKTWLAKLAGCKAFTSQLKESLAQEVFIQYHRIKGNINGPANYGRH